MNYATRFYNVMNILEDTEQDLWESAMEDFTNVVRQSIYNPAHEDFSIVMFADDSSMMNYGEDIYITADLVELFDCLQLMFKEYPILRDQIKQQLSEGTLNEKVCSVN